MERRNRVDRGGQAVQAGEERGQDTGARRQGDQRTCDVTRDAALTCDRGKQGPVQRDADTCPCMMSVRILPTEGM